MVVPEALIVGQIPRPRPVINGHDQARAPCLPTDPATCLNVFGSRLRLAGHGHQSEAIDIDSYRDHVAGKYCVERGIVLRAWCVMPSLKPAEQVRNLLLSDPAR